MSGEVVFQRRHYPVGHAVKVTPSGRFASVRCKPRVFRLTGCLFLTGIFRKCC